MNFFEKKNRRRLLTRIFQHVLFESNVIIIISFLLSFHYSEYVKIADGNGTVQFYQTGCGSAGHGSLIEVPFGKSNIITVNFVLRKFKSTVRIQFLVIRNGLHAGMGHNNRNIKDDVISSVLSRA